MLKILNMFVIYYCIHVLNNNLIVIMRTIKTEIEADTLLSRINYLYGLVIENKAEFTVTLHTQQAHYISDIYIMDRMIFVVISFIPLIFYTDSAGI